jgi:hypothetical protein
MTYTHNGKTYTVRPRTTLATVRDQQHGFITAAQLTELAADPQARLTPVLIRCGGCRFTCPAQDAKHLIAIISRDGQDYVRDVSLPATEA